MKRNQPICAALAIAWAASGVFADSLYWQGGPGGLADANYYDNTSSAANVAPGSSDLVYVGADGTATSAADLSITRLFVGHDQSGGYAGTGTVTLTGGTLTLTNRAGGNGNGGLMVGYNNTGTLNIDGAGTAVSVAQLLQVGYGNSTTQSATLNITNGGSLTVATGDFRMGDATSGGVGIPGAVNVNGNLTISTSSAALQVGITAGSTFVQTGGTTSIGGQLRIGQNNADYSSFTLSGGTVTAGSSTLIGQGNADNSSFTITGGSYTTTGVTLANSSSAGGSNNVSFTASGGTVTVNGSFLAATGIASNTTINFSGDAVFTSSSNFVVADINSTSTGATLNISGNAHLTINGSSGLFLGRGTSTNTTLNMSGGQVDIAHHLLLGTAEGGATGIVVNHSGGAINTAQNLAIDDTTTGTATYNLSGTGSVTTTGIGIVGRQRGTGILNQTGGSATFNGSLQIGNAFSTNTGLYATGIYNLYAGSVTAVSTTTADALSIAAAGTGTLRIYGSDATVTVTGNLKVNANSNGSSTIGTLAYVLQPGESLTTIQASGTATFAAGSALSFDTSGVTPATSYNLITATDIINSGLTLSAPSGWHLDAVDGSGTKTLQIFTALPGDANRNGTIDADDFALIDRGYAMQLNWWHNGDFNDSGVIDAADYLILDQSFVQQGGVFSPELLADRESRFGPEYTATLLASVPEPAGLSVLGLGLASVLTRRRRQAR